jgi:hypothetical protein
LYYEGGRKTKMACLLVLSVSFSGTKVQIGYSSLPFFLLFLS